jgi:hypothetical protein
MEQSTPERITNTTTPTNVVGSSSFRFVDVHSSLNEYYCDITITVKLRNHNGMDNLYDITYNCKYGYKHTRDLKLYGYTISGSDNISPWNSKRHSWHTCNPLYNQDTGMFVSSYDSRVSRSRDNAPQGKAGEIINKNPLTDQLIQFLLMNPNDMGEHIGHFQPLEYKKHIIQFIDKLYN